MSGAEFILPGERKSHHELKQSVFSVIQQLKGPTTSHGLGKTDVSKPYGYLAIDLKPDTPNDKRLMCLSRPIRHQQESSHISVIQSRRQEEQTVVDPASDPNFRKPGHCQSYPPRDLKTYKRGTLLQIQFSEEPMNVGEMASIMARASCDECGLLFETLSDLQNHVRN